MTVRNIDSVEMAEAIAELIETLTRDNPEGVHLKVILNDCDGYPTLVKISEYVQRIVATSSG